MSNENNRIRSAQSAKGSLEFKYDIEKLKKENRYRVSGAPFPKSTKKFNWGACIITPIWALFNNKPLIALISFIIPFIPMMGWIFAIIFSIYCGTQGNDWAWESNKWQSVEQFHEVQRKWAMWAVIIESALFITFAVFAMNFINTFNKSIF